MCNRARSEAVKVYGIQLGADMCRQLLDAGGQLPVGKIPGCRVWEL